MKWKWNKNWKRTKELNRRTTRETVGGSRQILNQYLICFEVVFLDMARDQYIDRRKNGPKYVLWHNKEHDAALCRWQHATEIGLQQDNNPNYTSKSAKSYSNDKKKKAELWKVVQHEGFIWPISPISWLDAQKVPGLYSKQRSSNEILIYFLDPGSLTINLNSLKLCVYFDVQELFLISFIFCFSNCVAYFDFWK